MKFNFTLLGMALFLLFSSALMSQTANTLVVSAPAEIAGAYEMLPVTGWGGNLTANLAGPATFIDDGAGVTTDACDGTIADLGVFWGIADRGDCQFGTKALAIQLAGGNVAVICNNVPGEGPPNMGVGDNGDGAQVTIPVIGLSFETCETLRVVGQGTQIDVNVEFRCGTQDYGPEYIWGTNTGEGDFNGGLGEWTVVSDAPNGNSWIFDDNPALDEGGSNCNGYASFPTADYFFDSRNGGCDIPGFADGSLTESCNGSLISPTITLDPAAIDENLVCEFNHFYEYFRGGLNSLVISWDDGASWPDTFNITAALDVQVPSSPFYPTPDAGCQIFTADIFVDYFQNKRIHIDTYNGQSSIKLQFLHVGYLYETTIDDVALLNLPDYHDMELSQTFFSSAPAWEIPQSQAQEVALHADIINVGISPVSPVLEATAFTEDGTQVFQTTFDGYGSQPGGCFLNQNLSFPDFFTPTELGANTVFINNITPGDARDTDDDDVGFFVNLTENTWSTVEQPTGRFANGELRDMFTGFVAGPTESFDANYAIAYPFYVPNGEGHFLNTIRFGIQNRATNSGNIFAYVLKWTPGEFSFPLGGTGAEAGEPANPSNYNIDPRDTEVVGVVGSVFGFNSARIPISQSVTDVDGNPINWEDFSFDVVKAGPDGSAEVTQDADFKPLALEDDSYYVVVMAVQPATQVPVDFISGLSQDSNRGTIYHGASNFAYASAGRLVRPNAHFSPLFDGFTTDDVFNIGWSGTATEWGPNTPWLEMDINPTPKIASSTEDISSEVAAGISIFPNPVSDNLTINVDLQEVSSTVRFDLMNISGELVRTDSYSDVQRGTFNMNVADLIPGVYTLNVRSEAGFTAKKVIIQK